MRRDDLAVKQFREALRRRDVDLADALGRNLLAQAPGNHRTRFQLANLLERTGRGAEAHALIAGGMDADLRAAIDSTIASTYSDLGISEVRTTDGWRFIALGVSAVCSIKHHVTVDGTRLYTKVVNPASRGAAIEHDFYTSLAQRSATLSALAPRLIDHRQVKGTPYAMITLEWVVGRRPDVRDIAAVRETWLRLMRASEELVEQGLRLARSRFRDGLRRWATRTLARPPLWPETAAWLHTPRGSNDLFATITNRLRKLRACQRLITAAERLQSFWFSNTIHRRIRPDHHYTLVHGDFHEANLIVEVGTGACRIIDWESASWGPPSLDFSRFAAGLNRFEFKHFWQARLLELVPEISGPSVLSDRLTHVLLVVMAAGRWITQHEPERVDARFDETIGPAVEWLLTKQHV